MAFDQISLQQLDHGNLTDAPIRVKAGVGGYVARQLAALLGLAYKDSSEILANEIPDSDLAIADCAPTVVVACLSKSRS